VVAAELRAIKRGAKNGVTDTEIDHRHNGLMCVRHNEGKRGVSCNFIEGFSCLANGRHGIGIPAFTHHVFCTFSATYSTRLLKK
jgi:hypothetical protein